MLMIPDATGVYTEAGPPRVYNYAMAAWKDTTGRVWNPELEAWQDVWPVHRKLYLYRDGDECTDITGGWNPYPYNAFGGAVAPQFVRGASSMSASMTGNNTGAVATAGAIPMDRYNSLYALVSAHSEVYSGVAACITGALSQTSELITHHIVDAGGDTVTDKTERVDISQITGSQRVVFRLMSNCSVTIRQVWLE